MMGPGETMVVIAVIVLSFMIVRVIPELYKKRLEYKTRALEVEAAKLAERAGPTANTERLEARLRVLERIATDKSTHLAAQIDDLRDPAFDKVKEVN